MNEKLQAALNPPAADKAERAIVGCGFRVGDRVMQPCNNCNREVCKGDLGRVVDVDLEMQTLVIDFDGRPVTYDGAKADELALAYAARVHRAQGSEYPAVVRAGGQPTGDRHNGAECQSRPALEQAEGTVGTGC